METINIQCKSTSQIHRFKCLLYGVSCLSGRAYIGEVLIKIWLESMKK